MIENDYLNLFLYPKNEHINFSALESKFIQVNESSDNLDLFFTELNSCDLLCFDRELAKLNVCNGTVDLKTKKFDLKIKSNNIAVSCGVCATALYGYFDVYQDLTSKFCNKSVHEVCNIISNTNGSYSLVYVSLHGGFVVVAKDQHGSKSLLVSFEPSFTISNVSFNTHSKWYEFPPFVFLALGDTPYLFKRSQNHLHRLAQTKNVDYNTIDFETISLVVDKVAASLAESISQLVKLRITQDVISILFSGCVDSSLIALIALNSFKDMCIELINVSFDPKASPDRITSLFTYEELIRLYPDRDIRLILVDVDPEEYLRDEPEIYGLSYPNQTHMDLNISASVYYAGALKGYLFSKEFFETEYWSTFKNNTALLKSINFKVTVSKDKKSERGELAEEMKADTMVNESDSANADTDEKYISKSEYVVMGTGADELFGGYGRHVSAKMFNEKTSFSSEINKDILRLWKRNLGRDDRVLNHRNIKALYPFLSANVLECLGELPLSPAVIVDYLDPPEWFRQLGIYGHIDSSVLLNSEFISSPGSRSVSLYVNKWILREICHKLGLRHCCNFKKRAIQFGTRSAKVFNRIHNMTNRQASNKGAATFVI
ncbi:uncharacterized protein TOT_010000365 [Theileria orientalis strain Shintoku]|uniref:Asparagine synthase n=1 Tax=Theileria orientalis strain Shintoku TaxID=869250 RepID=J4C7E5_THEOR|nr:uncharacterized protein TOT_010000365 [Theileria orientalis strain Shintoku]PVC52697.1 hypothetical protein MACL_00000587 [Theileria orientalis]BAM38898.1 uncharacterized protein TOT_010000365 [Theileria orientalis strain Shintoku]|eukprot:XP_009689199.1 uncharacterized protein TOT_010000365 [Theileria orientalis strain Shintoku]